MSQMPDKIWVHKDTKYSTGDIVCGYQYDFVQAVAFWPAYFDPDIPAYPYCRECLDEEKRELMMKLFKIDKP